MEKVYKNLEMVIPIKDFMRMENHVDMDNIFGQWEVFLKEILKMD